MSVETPRTTAGSSTPRSFQEVFCTYDFEDRNTFIELYANNGDDQFSSDSSCQSECICEKDNKELQVISKLINAHSEYDGCEKQTICKLSRLERRFTEESLTNYRQMQLMIEYEKKIREWFTEKNIAIEKLQSEKNDAEIENMNLQKQLAIVTNHLSNLEDSFTDIHKKYERAKNTMQILNSNLQTLKDSLKEFEEYADKKHLQFEQLKEHAMERLSQANLHIDLTEKNYFLEQSKLRKSVEDSEIKVQQLTEELEQKNRVNAELISICKFLLQTFKTPKNCSLHELIYTCATQWLKQVDPNFKENFE